ncbi:hypothetical protein, partial [Achromobacter xylosoxidans]|uniref:hypothetical protein n=1 Tax=Alcaligenes xylosoxydans xylosoxydans TaxID=85698 RepID=UPI001EED4D79
MTQQDDITQRVLTDDEIREVIFNAIGFGFDPGELQSVNADDLMKIAHDLPAEHHLNELMRLTQPWPNATIPCATVRSHVEQALSKLRAPVADERAAVDPCGYVAVKVSAVDWLKDKFPALTIKAGLCERIGGRLYTITRLMRDHDTALASAPVADESPMAKMADALREKARQEQQTYQDRRAQATEWGPLPEGTEADLLTRNAPVAHVAGDETSRYFDWAKDRSAWEMPVGTPVYYSALASAPVADAIQWPTMPESKGQSPILFEDGYAEGWAKCMGECRRAVSQASAPVAGEAQPSDAEVLKVYAETVAEYADGRGFEAGTVAFARSLLRRYAAPQASAEYERGHADGWAA